MPRSCGLHSIHQTSSLKESECGCQSRDMIGIVIDKLMVKDDMGVLRSCLLVGNLRSMKLLITSFWTVF